MSAKSQGRDSDTSSTSDKPVAAEILEMVEDTLREVPGAMKFMITNPEIIKKMTRKRRGAAATKSKKQAQATQKAATRNQEKSTGEAEAANSDAGDSEAEAREQKRVKRAEDLSDGTSEPEEDAEELTAYILVEKPLPDTKQRGSRSSKISEDEKYMQRGPFKFKRNESYVVFLRKISQALPCPILNIVEDKIKWKPSTPQNACALLLGGETGYPSMIEACLKKKSMVMLLMLLPTKPADNHPIWDTGNEKDQVEEKFNYADLEMKSTEKHILEQRVQFDKAVGPVKQDLEMKYPISNNPLFPNKCIYTDTKTGFHWELNEIHLSVWASHIARNTATLDQPPISQHFDYKSRLQRPPASAIQTAAPMQAPSHVAAMAAPPASTLMEMLMMSMLQQQQMSMSATRAGNPVLGNPAILPNPNQPNTAMVVPSHSDIQVPAIGLDTFCQRYGISETDKERLKLMEFCPGDGIEALSSEEWRDRAGFQMLSWQRLIQKNRNFLDDVQKGIWN